MVEVVFCADGKEYQGREQGEASLFYCELSNVVCERCVFSTVEYEAPWRFSPFMLSFIYLPFSPRLTASGDNYEKAEHQ